MPSKKPVIKAYVTPEEYSRIIDKASSCALSVSTFAKRVCLGYVIQTREDQQARRELLQINADLGRLGGLLKMWLTNDDGYEDDVRALLHQIEERQEELKEAVKRI